MARKRTVSLLIGTLAFFLACRFTLERLLSGYLGSGGLPSEDSEEESDVLTVDESLSSLKAASERLGVPQKIVYEKVYVQEKAPIGSDYRYWERLTKRRKPIVKKRDPNEKFLSFEPWNGGFNNIRQSLEIAASLAFATNRTLAFPPPWNMYLRGKSGLEDYFDLADITKGLPVIMYEEFKTLIHWKPPGQAFTQAAKTDCPAMGAASKKVPVKYDLAGFSWDSAAKFCNSKGVELCCAASVCDRKAGEPFFEAQGDDVWVPVADDENEWLQVGKDKFQEEPRVCQTHGGLYGDGPQWGRNTQTDGLRQHIVCCGTPSHRRRHMLSEEKVAYEEATEVDLSGALRQSTAVNINGQSQRRQSASQSQRHLLGQSQDYERFFGGIEFTPGVLLIGPKPGDPWYTDIFCIPECPKGMGPLHERFQKFNTQGSKEKMQFGQRTPKFHSINEKQYTNAKVIHFRQNLLGQFYQQLWFQDPMLEVATKRFVRNHIHFSEKVIGPAEKIIETLGDKQFSCIHVRRGDFQYHQTRATFAEVMEATRALFLPGERIYIATDERDKSFFKSGAAAGWNLTYWDDYAHLTKGTPGFIIPCSEMSVCSRARIFVGTQLSTFSGYIQRTRGYMDDQPHKEVYDTQTVFPSGYAPSWSEIWDHPTCGWCREFKESWEGL